MWWILQIQISVYLTWVKATWADNLLNNVHSHSCVPHQVLKPGNTRLVPFPLVTDRSFHISTCWSTLYMYYVRILKSKFECWCQQFGVKLHVTVVLCGPLQYLRKDRHTVFHRIDRAAEQNASFQDIFDLLSTSCALTLTALQCGMMSYLQQAIVSTGWKISLPLHLCCCISCIIICAAVT